MTELQQLEYDNQVIERFLNYHFVEDVEQDPIFDQLQSVIIRYRNPERRQRLDDALDLIKMHLEAIQIRLRHRANILLKEHNKKTK